MAGIEFYIVDSKTYDKDYNGISSTSLGGGVRGLDVYVKGSVLPAGAATEATLTSLNSKITKCDTDTVQVTNVVSVSGIEVPAIVGVKNASDARINPATEETLTALNGKVTKADTDNVQVTNVVAVSGMANVATTPYIYNVEMADANTEYSKALPNNTKRFSIKLRSNAVDLQLSYISEQSNTIYETVNRGISYYEENLDATGVTLYFRTASASQVAEISAWV